jgi:alanine racemase
MASHPSPPDTRAHGGLLTIDLRAVQDNWHLLSARTPGTETGAVVKADAYGLGTATVAKALVKAGCRTFFVAHLSEAAKLRAVDNDIIIYVLNGLLPGTTEAFHHLDARPVLGSPEEVAEWRETGKSSPCALHVDTGMNRLGLDRQQLGNMRTSKALEGVGIDLVMTHFSASEVKSDPANAMQVAAFADVAALFPDTRCSLLNSSGHFLPGAPAHALTRPGYALYGGNPTPGEPNPMRQVVRLEAPIIQTRMVEAGTRAGYNGRWTARRASRLATVSLGYADGYARNAGGFSAVDGSMVIGGEALVGGVICPFVGSVSMDLVIIDATDAPAMACGRGELVTLIGGPLDLERVGSGARTVGYEMLTSLGRRYQRHYIGS